MVLTKAELLTALQSEVRILLHLAGKVDRAQLDYRPTPKQRSTLELLRYMSMMGPTFLWYLKTGNTDGDAWGKAAAAADARDFEATLAAIAAQHDIYASLLADISDAEMREPSTGADGQPTTRGAAIVTGILCGCAAYRTQLFLYLKACGRVELTTTDLWAGVDAPA